MLYDEWVVLQLFVVVLAGILLFDLYLLVFNGKMTISRACWRVSVQKPWIGICICAAICYLIAHLWGSIVP